jgi:hypothetical protein
MSVVFSLFLWIVWDVAFSVCTEIEVRQLTPPEWILAGTGIVFAVLALIFEFREREKESKTEATSRETHLKEISEIKERLASSAAKSDAKLDVVAMLGVETVRGLQDVTQTTGEPIAKTIQMATEKIQTLQGEVSDLRSMFWRRLTVDERATLRERVTAIGQYSFRIVSAHPADCHELASDLVRVLESAGWLRATAPPSIEEHDLDDWDLAHTSGVRILGKYPDNNEPGPKLADALKPLIKFGPSFSAALSSGEVADVVLFIGPKGARTMQP